MASVGFIALLIAFSYIVETLLVSVVTKLLNFHDASVPKAAWAVLSSYVCTILLMLPFAFLFEYGGNMFDMAFLIIALIASTIVFRSVYQTSWLRGLVAAGLVAVSWGLITFGLSLVEASMR